MTTLPPTSSSQPDSVRMTQQAQVFSPALLLQALRTQKRTLTVFSLAGLALATILAFLLPLSYTATATFLPPGSNTGMSSASAMLSQLSALGGGSLLGGKSSGELYVAILKSRTVADEMIHRFKLMDVYRVKKLSNAEKQLSQSSLFAMDSKDPLVTITVTDRSPERARDLANGYLQTLQSTSENLAVTESSQRRLFYEQRLDKEKNALADAEVDLKQVEEKTGLIAPTGQTMAQIQTLAQLQAQITDREVRMASLLHDETSDNPDVIRLREEIGSLRAQVNQMEKGSGKESNQIATANVPTLQLDYVRKAREVKYHEALFDAIAKQYEAARLDEAKDSPLQILDWATLPDTKSGPHRSILMVLGLFLGFVAGVARVLLKIVRS